MSETNIPTPQLLMPTKVATGARGEIPAFGGYLMHFIRATVHVKEGELGKPSTQSICAEAEIVAPETVNNEAGQPCAVAGLKVTAYMGLSPTKNGGDPNIFEFADKLGLREANGGVDPAKIMRACNSGSIFFMGVAMSEPSYVCKPGTETPVLGPTGQPILRGYRPALLDHSHIIQRVDAPPGFPVQPY